MKPRPVYQTFYRRFYQTSVILGAVLGLGACSGFEPTVEVTDAGGIKVLSYTASLAHTVIIPKASNAYICSQPPPDASFSQAEQADLSIAIISAKGTGDDAGDEAEKTEEQELSGRTPAVLMAREMFFRLCEFSRNHRLKSDQAVELYKKTIDTVKEVWATEAGNTTITIGDTLSTAVTEAITNALNKQSTASTAASSGRTSTSSGNSTSSE